MKYRLTIEQFGANPNYETEMESYRESSRRRNDYMGHDSSMYPPPSREAVVKVLSVEVTDAEFAAIKKAALETMGA